MEWLLLIGGYLLYLWLKQAIFSGPKSAGGPLPASNVDIRDFEATVERNQVDIGGVTAEMFEVFIRGRISAPRGQFPYQLVLKITDVTNGRRNLVFCGLDAFQEELTPIVEARTNPEVLPYQSAVITSWVKALGVPIDFLSLPRSGLRTLEFSVLAVAAQPEAKFFAGHLVEGEVLESATTTFTISWIEPGYEDLAERRLKADELALQLAMAVSASDGQMATSEGRVIRDWLAKRIESISDEDKKKDEKNRINMLVQGAYADAKAGRLNMATLCAELLPITDKAYRYDVLELCFHVAAADGTAEQQELEMLRALGKELRVDLDRLRTMEHKLLPVSIHAGSATDDDALLGITDDMSPSEVRKHLNREYRKWNSLTSHNDPDKRTQAQEMISRIALARRKYVT